MKSEGLKTSSAIVNRVELKLLGGDTTRIKYLTQSTLTLHFAVDRGL